MTAAMVSAEQWIDLDGTLTKLRADARGNLADILERAMAEVPITSGDSVRLHVYADYCDRSGMRHRCAAIKALLR